MAVYKVRMMVLELVTADNPEDAKSAARETAEDAGLDILNIEEPERSAPLSTFGSAEEDIYP